MGFSPRTRLAIPRADLNEVAREAMPAFNFIGRRIFQPMPVGNLQGSFGLMSVETLLRGGDDTYSKKAGYQEDDTDLSEVSYACKRRGRMVTFDEEERAVYASLLDYEAALLSMPRFIVEMNEERRAMALCHDTATFPLAGTTGLTVSVPWNNWDISEPIADVQFGVECIRGRMGAPASMLGLQISHRARVDLSNNHRVLEKLKYTQVPENGLSDQELARALGVGEVTVADAMSNTANQGLTAALADVWDPTYAFLYVRATSKNLAVPCVGRTFYYDAIGGLGNSYMYERDPETNKYVWRTCTQTKRYNTKAGFLFGSVYVP